MSRRSALLALFAPAILLTCGRSEAGRPPGDEPASSPPAAPAKKPVETGSSFRFAAPPTSAVEVPVTPFSLTASDGSGLRLVAMEGRAVVEGPLAYTELHLSFENPEDRVREGTFEITLPTSGTVSRFAMKVGDRWMEGEMVERQRARQIYEDFLHRRQDPALLEQQAANAFSARVFPIPARATKEIILAYSHELADADEPFRVPLRGLPEVERLDLSVLVSKTDAGRPASNLGGQATKNEVVRVQKQRWTPDQDLVVPRDERGAAGLRSDDLVVARVSPSFAAAQDRVDGLYVLVDTSASRALGFEGELGLVRALAEALAAGAGPSTPLAVAAFDQQVAPIYSGAAGGFGDAPMKKLTERMALGASDTRGALAWLRETLAGADKPFNRLLVVTDGVSTAGETENEALRAAVAALGEVGVTRVDALAVGGIRDQAALRALVTAGLERDGVVIDGDQGAEEAGRRLSLAVRSGIKVEVPGAEWVWPETLDGVQPGDDVLVYAGLPAGKGFSVSLDGERLPLGDKSLATVPRPLLERASARARIERLSTLRETRFASDQDLREAMKQQAIQLSLRHRVLSPWTALLVLETEADYVRYGLDRSALADILTVGPGGLEVLDRRGETIAPIPPPVVTRPTPDLERKVEATSSTRAGPRREAARDSVDDAPATVAEAPPPPAPPPPPGAQPMDEDDAMGDVAEGGEAESEPVAYEGAEGEDEIGEGEEEASVAEEPMMSFGRAAPRVESAAASAPAERRRLSAPQPSSRPQREERPSEPEKRPQVDPWSGPYAEVMELLVAGKKAEALARAKRWRAEAPGDVLALLALGAAFQANGEFGQAARAFGSLIDLFPSRADLRRTAGNWLEALGTPDALALAVDTYRQAVVQRPDHPNSHRMLAYALLAAGKPADAFAAIEAGLRRSYPSDRFAGVQRILQEDAAIIAAAWRKAAPMAASDVDARTYALGARLPTEPSLRFILSWETDANDVDFHIYDGKGGHAYYEHKELGSGGALYADVTTGYGPECFAIPGAARAFPYKLQAHYYSRGPMGFGMGTLVILDHDGKGGVRTQSQPFVVMNDDAFLDLGTIRGPLR